MTKKLKEEGYTVAVTFEKKEQLQTIVEKAFILLEKTKNAREVEHEFGAKSFVNT